MGTQGQENASVGPEYRYSVGERWGLRWAVAHPFVDLGKPRTLELIDAATSGQTLSGWRATMTQAEQAWWDAQPAHAQEAMLGAAKAARQAGWYT